MEARGNMMLAASIAGIGFGSAGTAIPHACAYPIASLKHAFRSPGYPDEPFVPHGFAVIATAPAAFRFTYPRTRKSTAKPPNSSPANRSPKPTKTPCRTS
jgi:alcohol dehydrogenase class IV